MSVFRFLVLVIAVLLLAGCSIPLGVSITGSGPLVTQEFDVARFSKVAAGSAFEVAIVRDESHSVIVTVNENLVDRLDVSVSGDTLRIYLKPGVSLRGASTLKAKVTMPELVGLDLSGATRTNLKGFSSNGPLEVEVSGASTLRGDVVSGDARFDASGASTVSLEGSARDLRIKASGASTVDFGSFSSQDTVVEASGASRVIVNTSGQLDVEASGASSVRYVGEPDRLRVNTSGASSVEEQ